VSALAHVGAGASGAPTGPPPEPTKKSRLAYLLLLPGAVWLLVFFVIPLVQLFTVSLQSQFPGYPGYYYRDVNVGNYWHGLHRLRPALRSVAALRRAGDLLRLLPGLPPRVCHGLQGRQVAGRHDDLVIAPFFTSFILRTVAWRQILADEGPVASHPQHPAPAARWPDHRDLDGGRRRPDLQLPALHGPADLRLARACRSPKIIEAGGDLYANGFTTFRTVTLPMSMPGVLAGTLLTFIPAAGDYVNAELLGSDNTKMVGNVIESQFFRVLGGFPTAAALSFTLMAIILALVFVYVRKFGTEELL
jgi:spermidine/putrescine transport system permease protein